ncbi:MULTISPECIES: hypothetical protein [unclassified Burkholderia]|uniref:hypothetical protein n=1 Tax=unclassified Burkholderia TaxID=2613784 RepID=UPI00114759B4|nr:MULTISPECIES: hypothetical protein [unclassified Burkholderia]
MSGFSYTAHAGEPVASAKAIFANAPLPFISFILFPARQRRSFTRFWRDFHLLKNRLVELFKMDIPFVFPPIYSRLFPPISKEQGRPEMGAS